MFSYNDAMKGQGGQGTHLLIWPFLLLRAQSSEEDRLEMFQLKYALKYCFHSAEQQILFFKNSSFLVPILCEKGQNQTSTDGSLLTSCMTQKIYSFDFFLI